MTYNQVNKNSQKIDRLLKIIKESEFKTNALFAKAIKMSPSYLSEVLNGKKEPPKYLGLKLEKFLNVNIDWWETGVGAVYLTPKDSSEFDFANTSFADKDKLILNLETQVAELREDKKRLLKELEEYKAKVSGLELELNQTKRRGTA
ncbi:hypothetical protein BWD42_04275 [Sphingobacterium sp. CZ-UAM]|uniref:helix-turn-helix domain-containing protein n=1 Tax=Sphingobacterium sp. CZ-UAM TaxID=1933868 RepID=UPI0009842CCE|nr:helix-turn-helix transcriptional regulator [Sphingobacterium sp. CZ-UAM]OOG19171.1 hypothetical protein BWD42_04275 [Sphingobacterium sp. CZ-UAM]